MKGCVALRESILTLPTSPRGSSTSGAVPSDPKSSSVTSLPIHMPLSMFLEKVFFVLCGAGSVGASSRVVSPHHVPLYCLFRLGWKYSSTDGSGGSLEKMGPSLLGVLEVSGPRVLFRRSTGGARNGGGELGGSIDGRDASSWLLIRSISIAQARWCLCYVG